MVISQFSNGLKGQVYCLVNIASEFLNECLSRHCDGLRGNRSANHDRKGGEGGDGEDDDPGRKLPAQKSDESGEGNRNVEV